MAFWTSDGDMRATSASVSCRGPSGTPVTGPVPDFGTAGGAGGAGTAGTGAASFQPGFASTAAVIASVTRWLKSLAAASGANGNALLDSRQFDRGLPCA